jgi:DUF971 family protein
MSTSTPALTNIKVRKGSRCIDFTFDNGDLFSLTFEFLRVHSPSAEVKGHGPGQEILQVGKQDVGIKAINPVGHYAMQIDFDDGHDSGLYSWSYLHELGANHDALWARYLDALDAAGASRDPQVQVIKLGL